MSRSYNTHMYSIASDIREIMIRTNYYCTCTTCTIARAKMYLMIMYIAKTLIAFVLCTKYDHRVIDVSL